MLVLFGLGVTVANITLRMCLCARFLDLVLVSGFGVPLGGAELARLLLFCSWLGTLHPITFRGYMLSTSLMDNTFLPFLSYI